MVCVLILNNINQHLIVVQLAFTQIFQLKGCGQYESQGNIMNVPTNLDLVQHILAQMPYHDSSIAIKKKTKVETKNGVFISKNDTIKTN